VAHHQSGRHQGRMKRALSDPRKGAGVLGRGRMITSSVIPEAEQQLSGLMTEGA
jgi:hypothetical protein